MDKRHRELIEQGDKLFSNRASLHSLWQEISLQFYPEMATFTASRADGEDFAEHLTTSYPLIARRTLGDTLSALLRPVALDTTSPGVWFGIRTHHEDRLDHEAKLWLERATKIQRQAMYERSARFVRATKEGDHSFASFGQCVIQIGINKAGDSLLYRSHHLRDVVWVEDGEGDICTVHRNWEPTASQLLQVFGTKASSKVKEMASREPMTRVKVRHVVIKSEIYEQSDATGKKFRQPWVSVWLDKDNDHLMEEVGSFSRVYVIPRWVTVPGSQYASSPAVTAALPDARLMQAMTLTILEAGEKFADPPLIGTQEVLRSDVNTFSGGITYVDAEYDERLGAAIRPLYQPTGGQGVGIGLQLRADIRESIAKAFFLDSLTLPPMDARERVTAFEVSQRISEWIRRAMPIFEPMEFEYNGVLCEETFDILMRAGAFGSYQDIPQSLRGQDIQFKFQSPIHESVERRKNEKFLEAKAALVQAAELDQGAIHMLDAREALRDIYDGIGVPMPWVRSEAEVEQLIQAAAEQQAMQQAMASAPEAATAAKDLGSAVKSFADAGQGAVA